MKDLINGTQIHLHLDVLLTKALTINAILKRIFKKGNQCLQIHWYTILHFFPWNMHLDAQGTILTQLPQQHRWILSAPKAEEQRM